MEPEGARSEVAANVPASPPMDAAPKWLTANTVPRFFNWGAFLMPTPWCLAMGQWVWALTAALSPVLWLVLMAVPEPDWTLYWETVLRTLAYAVVFIVSPLCASFGSDVEFLCVVQAPQATGGGSRVGEVLLALELCLAPLAVSVCLRLTGNRWAVRSRSFKDLGHFRTVQRTWAAWGVVIVLLGFVILFFYPFLMGIA
jgi:hypothetical protein